MFKPYYLNKSSYLTKYTLLPYLLEYKVIRFALKLTFFTKVIRLEYITQMKKVETFVRNQFQLEILNKRLEPNSF
jgi:hypothetical protein